MSIESCSARCCDAVIRSAPGRCGYRGVRGWGGALGALIALSTLTTAAFRTAILAAFPGRADDFPAAGVLLFGAWLTVILALGLRPALGATAAARTVAGR